MVALCMYTRSCRVRRRDVYSWQDCPGQSDKPIPDHHVFTVTFPECNPVLPIVANKPGNDACCAVLHFSEWAAEEVSPWPVFNEPNLLKSSNELDRDELEKALVGIRNISQKSKGASVEWEASEYSSRCKWATIAFPVHIE